MNEKDQKNVNICIGLHPDILKNIDFIVKKEKLTSRAEYLREVIGNDLRQRKVI